MKKEFIVSPAVRFHKDKYDEDGIVIMGIDHDECEDTFSMLSNYDFEHATEGFRTSEGRFVDKYTALEITGWGRQLRFKERKYLLPNDLYQ